MSAAPPRAVAAAAVAARDIGQVELERLRRRTIWVLFAAVALGSTGYFAAVTVGTIAAAELGGGAAFGGLPTAATVVGTATATALLSAVMLRLGRRRGLLLGLSIGAGGGALAFGSVAWGSLALLLVASALTGFANGSAQLSRYVASDLYPAERRASALGTVVWGATVGAVVGPNLIRPAGDAALALGLPELAGSYGLSFGFLSLGVLLVGALLRPEPYQLADPSAFATRADGTAAPSARTLLGHAPALVAIVSLLAGQVVMVLIMTMTPLHITDHGHGLETVGLVLSAHMIGMFALSPLSGRLTDRFGSPIVIGAGLVTLAVSAAMAALAPPDGGVILTVALFLLGYGWNLGFVAGSALLTGGLALAERTRLQGIADGLIWSSAALASLSSGAVVATASYAALGLIALGLLVLPVLLLILRGPGLLASRP